MRKFYTLAVAIMLMAFAIPAPASVDLGANTFEPAPVPPVSCGWDDVGTPMTILGWTATPWRSATGSFGGITWSVDNGNGTSGIDTYGIGSTDNTFNHDTREGGGINKTISTVGYQNLHIRYDFRAAIVNPGGGVDGSPKILHGDNAEQLCVQYSLDGGLTWLDAEWIRSNGGGGAAGQAITTPLQNFTSWTTRYATLPVACNGQASLQIRLIWQFNTGSDHGYLDNIKILGESIGSPDTTPPGPAGSFTVTPEDGRAHITWTNPSDSDFAGVTLVVHGDHVPTSPTDGVVLLDSWSFDPGAAGSFDDVGRDPGRQYYYAIWTKDGVPNYVASPATAACTMSAYLWRESFETYGLGLDLEDGSSGHWVVDKTTSIDNQTFSNNHGQITVTAEAASDGGKSAKIQSLYSSVDPGDASVSHFAALSGVDGLLHYHFDLLIPVQDNSGPFWYSDIFGGSSLFGRAFGWESNAALVVGNTSWGYAPAQGAWHAYDVIIDTAANISRFYIDGVHTFTGPHSVTTDNTTSKVRLYAHMWSAPYDGHRAYVDNMFVTAPLHPRVTSPRDGVEITTSVTPTITWSRYAAAAAINHRVRICTADAPDVGVVWDSGVISGGATSAVTAPLPNGPQLYAFVREETSAGWGYWSPTGTGGFHLAAFAPSAPVVTAPNVTAHSAKPVIVFTGDAHSSLQAKVTTDAAGTHIAWDSGSVTSTAYSVVSGYLQESTPYWAFVRVANSVGWSPWSAGVAFTVNRSGELVDIRHMDEPDILTADDPGPSDGFVHPVNSQFTSNQVTVTDPICGDPKSQALRWLDDGTGRSLRMHKIGTGTDFTRIDLDKGVTFVWSAAVVSESGGDGSGTSWRCANMLLADKTTDGAQTYAVAIRTLPDGIGIIADNASANEGGGTGFTHNWAAWAPSTGYRVIRLTGRNVVAGDYSSTVWNVYVNENPTAVLTATGTMTGSVIEGDASTWPTDYVAIGHGSSQATGEILFDWTALNGAGDFSTGQWNPVGGATSFATIGAAKAATGTESSPVTVNGQMVITKVATHTEMDPITLENITVQDGYYVQDVAPLAIDPAKNGLVSGVKVVSSSNMNGAVVPGAKVTSLVGTMTEQGGGRAIVASTVNIEGTADFNALALSQKSLMSACMTQNAGSNFDTSGMLVRVFGKVMLSNFDPNWGTLGAYLFYVDDGSGLIDGRETIDGVTVPGIRCLSDAADPNVVAPSVGDYVMIEGICAYEEATVDGSPKNVRTILLPTYTIVASGI